MSMYVLSSKISLEVFSSKMSLYGFFSKMSLEVFSSKVFPWITTLLNTALLRVGVVSLALS